HKLYGPKGIGALYVRRGARALLAPQSFGGGQEQGLRPGTLATHQIVGFGAAAELAAQMLTVELARIGQLRDRLWRGLESLPGIHLNGAAAPRVPHILNVSFEDVDGESLVAGLESLAVSTGSACSSASGDPSYVLRALGRGTRLAESSLRLSLGRFTTAEEVAFAAAAIRDEVTRLRGAAPGAIGSAAGGCLEGNSGALDSDPEDRIEGKSAGPWKPGSGDAPGARDGLGLGAEAYRLFRELPRAGTLADPSDPGEGGVERDTVLHGEAGGPAEEVWVRFHVRLDGDTVKDARFEVRGCPHTLAAAAWIACQLPGRRRSEGVPGSPHEWARQLGVPVEKLGRLLVLEDALIACGLSHMEADRR
ncbi:MAG TPA: aminotransferase class V-fold PLP-dependent enzyme, partial [Steroidobacteraceae bacterium]|nr:aminotransferase class V-fold PLP-dependent enzyme [Steroidobacteraceae bacterium]